MAVFYCKCREKKRFWAEFWWKADEDGHGWVFFDDDRGSETYGQSITTCSGCGERLHRGTLTTAQTRDRDRRFPNGSTSGG